MPSSLITSEMMRREMARALGASSPREIYWNDREIVYDQACWVTGAYPLRDPDLREVTVAYRGQLYRFTYSTYWLLWAVEEMVDRVIRPVANAFKAEQKARLLDA